MPIYEYVCKQCGKLNEVLQKVTDPAPARCDGCGVEGPLEKVVSRTSFVLKGGGWYADLYGSTKKGSESKSSAGAGSGEGGASSSTTSSGSSASTSTTTSTGSSGGSSGGGSSGGGSSGGGSGAKSA